MDKITADIVAAFDALARMLKSEHLMDLRELERAALHALFAYISRMPPTLELPLIRRIFANEARFGEKGMAQTAKVYADDVRSS